MIDRRRSPRLAFAQPQRARIRTVHEAAIDRLHEQTVELTATQPIPRGKRLVLQYTTTAGEVTSSIVDVVSCTPIACDDGMQFRLTLSPVPLAVNAPPPRESGMDSLAIAVLFIETPIQVRNVSAAGAELETPVHLPTGTIGQIEVEFDGARRVEWFRVCRIHTTQGCNGAHTAAAEFLTLSVAGAQSLRGAVRRFLAADAHLLIP